MADQQGVRGIRRRGLLAALGGTAGLALAARSGALPRGELPGWNLTTDVLVVGSGAAGACAAIEAASAGARVLLIESLPQLGGASAMSPGVIYAGGGTALQRACGVADTPQAMSDFIAATGAPHLPRDRIGLYCEQSPAHFDWLVAQGLRYDPVLAEGASAPGRDACLFYSGNELAWPSRDLAAPAPRGHRAVAADGTGGGSLMMALLGRARELGVEMQARVAAQQLVLERDGRVSGLVADAAGERRAIRARRGVVLACGGFIYNREMLRAYAPRLFDCAVPWGNMADLGVGIAMGIDAGASALRMEQGFVLATIDTPPRLRSGILVNGAAQRFVAEDSYAGVLGDAITYRQGGQAWLICDAAAGTPPRDDFPQLGEANTVGDLADQLGFPRGALQNTVAYYNQHAATGHDPLFRKGPASLRPLQGPPYRAWDLGVARAFLPAHTLGGLHTTLEGRVLDGGGEAIPGLYAAGRTAAGLPSAPYAASGLSLGDCTFFGRRAGRSAAGETLS